MELLLDRLEQTKTISNECWQVWRAGYGVVLKEAQPTRDTETWGVRDSNSRER